MPGIVVNARDAAGNTSDTSLSLPELVSLTGRDERRGREFQGEAWRRSGVWPGDRDEEERCPGEGTAQVEGAELSMLLGRSAAGGAAAGCAGAAQGEGSGRGRSARAGPLGKESTEKWSKGLGPREDVENSPCF